MKKVSFWSFIREKGGVTSNMLATAMVINYYFHVRVGIRSNHISNRMLDYYISECDHRVKLVVSDRETFSRDFPQYMHYLLKYDERFHADRRKVIGTRRAPGVVMYRPPEVFEEELYPIGVEELVLLDLSGRNNPDSYAAMEEADINVIFFSTDIQEIDHYFGNFPCKNRKALYVINGYAEEDAQFEEKMRCCFEEKYGVKKSRLKFIPYYENLRRACHIGEVDRMIEEETRQQRRGTYYKCVKEVGKYLLMCKAPE